MVMTPLTPKGVAIEGAESIEIPLMLDNVAACSNTTLAVSSIESIKYMVATDTI